MSTKAARGPDVELDAQELTTHLGSRYVGQVLGVSQDVTFEYQVGAAPTKEGACCGQGVRCVQHTQQAMAGGG